MITRRVLMLAGAAGLALPAWAKEGDTPLPPPLAQLKPLPVTYPDGAATTLGAELHDQRTTVISLWATWCGPCLSEMQRLAVMRAETPAEKLDIIGVNIDKKRDEKAITRFLTRGRSNFVQLRGEADAVYAAFGGSPPITLPRLYVFRPDGQPTAVFGKYSGGKTLKAIDAAVLAAMKG